MAARTPDTQLTETASQLRTAIVRTARVLRQEAAVETGLSPTQTAVLASIDRHGPVTPSELAEIERVKRPTMTRTLACLEREGLIERTPDPTDGRSSLVAVNDAGRERLAALRRRKRAYLARRLRKLDPEEVETLARAAALLDRMREDEQG
ncbi:MAG TPA: MarR family transcriptional regulator [Solirubrobacterales bacterium]|jgi:DNA-binding MarR family transcriptional regulator|nr:MarR family transcriptional regulator [Solirubrobacterales bacterium]HVY97387.1 MarR family transcriptional regulator [Solirubrobacterales bacterium]